MRRVLRGAITILLFFSNAAYAQNPRSLDVLTASRTGTYYRLVQDIGRLLTDKCGFTVNPIETNGSLYNLTHLKDRGIKLALVQSDVLHYVLARNDIYDMANWAKFYRYVLPLYPEDVHLVTKKRLNIKSLQDLARKNVAIGEQDSGTFVTSTLILKESQIQVKPLTINPDKALKRLLSDNLSNEDRVDAFFLVAGKPVPLLKESNDEFKNLTLVPITVKDKLADVYSSTKISTEDYLWLDFEVDTVSTVAVLMSYDYRDERCADIATIKKSVKDGLEELKAGRDYHDTWKTIDFSLTIPGWRQNECVENYADLPFSCSATKRCEFDTFCKDKHPRPVRNICIVASPRCR